MLSSDHTNIESVTNRNGNILTMQDLALIRPILAGEYQSLPDDELLPLLEDRLSVLEVAEVEDFIAALKKINWGKVAAGVLGGAASGATVGSLAAPGYGTAIGAGIGALAGGMAPVLAGVLMPSKSQPKNIPTQQQQPSPPRPTAAKRCPKCQQLLQKPVAGGGSVAVGIASSAASALSQILRNPQVLSSIASMITGAAGKMDVTLGTEGISVSRMAVLNAIERLADMASDEVSLLPTGHDQEIYLKNRSGEYIIDPDNAEQRALRVAELARQSNALFTIESEPGTPGETLIQPMSQHLSSRTRFRAGVLNTRVFPHSAICQLRMQMSRGDGRWFIGTGFYVGSQRILTAGHNVYHRRYGRATRMIVAPGRCPGLGHTGRPFGSFEISPAAMYPHPDWRRKPNTADFDLAMLRVTTRAPLGQYFQLEELMITPATGIGVCGYAADRDSGVDPNQQNIDYDTIRDLDAESFTYSLNTTGGSSGSPVFYISDTGVKAIGVHSRGHDRQTNRGCRLTNAKIAAMMNILDQALTDSTDQFTDEDPQDLINIYRDDGDEQNQTVTETNITYDIRLDSNDHRSRPSNLYLPEDNEDAGLSELETMGAFSL